MSVEWILSSCVMIFLVVLVRAIFRKRMQPHIRYALWLAVALRLLLPVSFSATAVSVLNLLPERTGAEEVQGNGMGQSLEQAAYQGFGTDFGGGIAESIPEVKNVKWGMQIPGAYSLPGRSKPDAGRLLRCIWALGAVFWCIVLLGVNLNYAGRLRRGRTRITGEGLPGDFAIPVYIAEMIPTPCLFGLFRPSIYVTAAVAENRQTLTFVLCHENAHYQHHDNWWVFVRNLCLCLHWYNPLVWLAAYLSRQDGELACDEKVLEVLGSEVRVDYGRTLLELSTAKFSGLGGWRISTAMGGSKRQLSERLHMIVDAPGKVPGIRVLLLAFMVFVLAVAFTGRDGRSLAAEEQDEGNVQIQAQGGEGPSQMQAQREEEPTQIQAQGMEAPSKMQVRNGEDSSQMQEQGMEKPDVPLAIGNGQNLKLDLNFDGRDDLCLPGEYHGGENVPYYCMIWDQEKHQYEKSVMLYNIETDEDNQWIISRMKEEDGRYSTTYYRYDENNGLHMLRYVEEDLSPDAVFEKLDLTYVEDDSMYFLPAIVDGTDFHRVLLAMAKQSLMELYQWTGEKVDTACFQVTNMGSVYFGMTPEDIRHSRTFFFRDFGADTVYNLSNYEKSISSIHVASGRRVWFSPVLWRVFPDRIDEMTDEEVLIWYLEHSPLMKDCTVKSVEKRYEDMWTVQDKSGVWFEVVYDVELREVLSIYGPYPDYPEH